MKKWVGNNFRHSLSLCKTDVSLYILCTIFVCQQRGCDKWMMLLGTSRLWPDSCPHITEMWSGIPTRPHQYMDTEICVWFSEMTVLPADTYCKLLCLDGFGNRCDNSQKDWLPELDKKNKIMTEEQKNKLLWGGSCDWRGPALCF